MGPGRQRESFLDGLTSERLMTAAMLCDGLDECMILLRLVDDEDIAGSTE